MALPASKPNSLDTSQLVDGTQPLPADTSAAIDSAGQVDLTDTSSYDEDTETTVDAGDSNSVPVNDNSVPLR